MVLDANLRRDYNSHAAQAVGRSLIYLSVRHKKGTSLWHRKNETKKHLDPTAKMILTGTTAG